MKACDSCKRRHKKCIIRSGESECELCVRRSLKCSLKHPSSNILKDESGKDKESLMKFKDQVYKLMFENSGDTNLQFVCSTQPLASLLSKDSFLCFDGDFFDLYYPWSGINDERINTESIVNADLFKYIDSQGAFVIPPLQELKRLIKLYLDHIYPFYPVIERNQISNLRDVPLMILNAIFLSAIRLDVSQSKKDVRKRAECYYNRCLLLEKIQTNRIVLIQSYLLMSIQEEGMEGARYSKEIVTKACNLCGELAITNMGGSNGIDFKEYSSILGKQRRESDTKTTNYPRSLLKRIFWTAFCCDRLVSATCGREMYFNSADLMVDELSLEDFELGEYQQSDYSCFVSWLSICRLVDRIQCACYRPPPNRTSNDRALAHDLFNWKPENEYSIKESLGNFLNIFHAYAMILYLRCRIDPITLIVDSGGMGKSESVNENIHSVHSLSESIINMMSSNGLKQHILVVHAVLHAFSLIQLESKSRAEDVSQANVQFEKRYGHLMRRSKEVLNNLKDYWWFASAALELLKLVLENNGQF